MLQPKRNSKKVSPTKKYNTSNSKTQDSLAEDVFEIFDPTGISSYDDVYRSYKDNGLFSWQTGLEVLGALPIIGKVGKGIKAGRTANKYIKALTKVNKTVAKSEKVVPKVLKFGKEFGTTAQKVSRGGQANPVAAASIGVGMGAEGFQKLTKIIEKTTGKGVKKIISKAPAKKAAIKTTGATLNTVNTLSDVAGAVQGQVVDPTVEKVKSTKQQGKPKVVYYNTNPKRGEVEKPGDEEGVQYVPISNSVQLEKWKAQNNVPVTSDLKTKVAREVLGTLMPDQAAQFLTAIATKDNKLGLQDLTPDIQEALIKSVKNAQKRTGKDSGGTQYIDYSPEVEQAFQGMSAGKKQMISTDPDIQAATMLGRVSYKKNALGETEIYDSYDFSKTNPEKADTFYKKVRAYAGTALPDDGKKPNLIGKIPAEELALGTGEDGINPNKPWLAPSSTVYQDPNFDFLKQTQEPMDFSKAQLESQGFADIGVSKNTGKFNIGSGINFNPESLAARVGASFDDKGFNSSLNYIQGEKGLSEVNVNAGYGNDFIQGEVDYSKTNSGDSLSGNLSAGNDKLRMILEYLKDSEGTNLKGGIQSTTALREGLLNSALEVDTNFEDPKISGRINYTNPTGRLNLNAGASYSEGEKANFNAGLNYSFALGTDKNGIMKSKMNPRKKYANGTDAKGMNPNNYIISPSEALADYDIMMAKAENAAVNNPWAPYVSAIGGAASSFLSNSAGLLTADGAGIKGNAGGILKKAISKGGKIALNSAGSIAEGLAANGMNNVQSDVEVEGGEMYETPQGQVGEFQGPSHEQGGIPLEVGQDVEEGTKVYSDRLKIGDKTLAERKESRERQIANLEKIASQPLVDQAVKNASKRKMMAIQKEEMADLDFQEKVNNIQQMADTVVAAFGTSMAGLQDNPIGDSMEYGYGSSMTGVQKYDWGTPPFGVRKNPYADPLNYDTNAIKNLHDALGIASTEKGYGTAVGPKTLKAYQGFATDYMKKQGYSTANPSNFPDISRFYKNGKVTLNQGEAQALGLTTEGNKYIGPASTYFSDMGKDMKSTLPKTDFSTEALASRLTETKDPFSMTTASEKFAKDNPLPEGIDAPMAKGIDFQSKFFPDGFSSEGTETGTGTESKEPSKFKQALVGSIPSLGDATKLFGNLLGMNAGIKTATEQRSTDVPFQNVFRNAGEESQRMLDNAKQGIETNKAQAIVKANANTRTGMKGGRGARSFNAKQGMDWLYNTALNQQIADITANAAQQMSGIDIQKSGVAMSADQLKGQGEWQRITADAAAKDAYYTALALGRKDQATGMQQMGKDLNSMKENKIIEGLMKQYGTYFTGDKSGVAAKSYEELTGKNAKEEIFIGPDGKTKFKLGKNNQLTQVT